MTPTQCLYGFRSVLRIKRDCFPLYNRSSKQSHSVEERNKICKQHSASCLNGVNRISVPQNGGLHEAIANLGGISCVMLRHGSLHYIHGNMYVQNEGEGVNRILNDYISTFITQGTQLFAVSHRWR